MANIQGSKINDTWAKAMASYKQELNEKQYQMVKALTSPQDIIVHMKQLEKDRTSSSSGKFIDRVKGVTDCLVRFSNIVDTMTLNNLEASLIWGSLKLLLTIAHLSSEVYKKICESFMMVGENFQIMGLLADTFAQSDLVSDCIVRYYCSILRFWRKTLKHFRRNKIINLFRGAWYNYDREFGDFEHEMKRLRDESHQAANAIYMNEGKQALKQQNEQHKSFSYEFRNTEEKNQHRELVKWLSPASRDAKYYVEDFESARKSHHPCTCEWILKKPEFQQWLDSDGADPQTRVLWVSAIAGAGKTVMSAFIIRHFRVLPQPPTTTPILYFFFKNTDDEKNSVLSLTRSLLHQLYISLHTDELSSDLASLKDDSGKDSMVSDESAWDLFRKHAQKAPGLILVLDALDECKHIDELLDRTRTLARDLDVRVF